MVRKKRKKDNYWDDQQEEATARKKRKKDEDEDEDEDWWDDQQEEATAADQVKEMQRSDPVAKRQWSLYCEVLGKKIKDPAKHDTFFVEDFITQFEAGVRWDDQHEVVLLADQVKEMQRRDPVAKRQWDLYCEVLGDNTKDPAKHDTTFIEHFITEFEAGVRWDGLEKEEASLVDQVKEMQRSDPVAKAQWSLYCEVLGDSIKDPAKHDTTFIEDFIAQFEAGVRWDDQQREASTGQRDEQQEEASIVDQVKEMQRRDSVAKKQWETYCEVFGENIRDPARHEEAFIKDFITQYKDGVRWDYQEEEEEEEEKGDGEEGETAAAARRRRRQRAGEGGEGETAAAARRRRRRGGQGRERPAARARSPLAPPPPWMGPTSIKREVDAFVEANGLDKKAACCLRQLEPHLQEAVLARGVLKNVNNTSAALMVRIKDAKEGREPEPRIAARPADWLRKRGRSRSRSRGRDGHHAGVPYGKPPRKGMDEDRWQRQREENNRAGAEGRTLYARGIPTSWTKDRLEEFFGHQGRVTASHLLPKKEGQPGRAAFINFATAEDTLNAAQVCDCLEVDEDGERYKIVCSLKGAVGQKVSHVSGFSVLSVAKQQKRAAFFSNLPREFDEEAIRMLCMPHGTMLGAEFVSGKESQATKSAFAIMSSKEEVEKLIAAFDGQLVHGKTLMVAFPTPPKQTRTAGNVDGFFIVEIRGQPPEATALDIQAIIEGSGHDVQTVKIQRRDGLEEPLAHAYMITLADAEAMCKAMDQFKIMEGFVLSMKLKDNDANPRITGNAEMLSLIAALASEHQLDDAATNRLSIVFSERLRLGCDIVKDLADLSTHLAASNRPSALVSIMATKLRTGQPIGFCAYGAPSGQPVRPVLAPVQASPSGCAIMNTSAKMARAKAAPKAPGAFGGVADAQAQEQPEPVRERVRLKGRVVGTLAADGPLAWQRS